MNFELRLSSHWESTTSCFVLRCIQCVSAMRNCIAKYCDAMQSTLIRDATLQVELHCRLLYCDTTSGTCCTTFIRIFQQCIAMLRQCKTVCDLRLLSRLSCVAGGKLHLLYLLQIIVLRHHQWHLLHYIYKNISTVHCNTRPVQNRV